MAAERAEDLKSLNLGSFTHEPYILCCLASLPMNISFFMYKTEVWQSTSKYFTYLKSFWIGVCVHVEYSGKKICTSGSLPEE